LRKYAVSSSDGAVADHDPAEVGDLPDEPMAERGELFPFGKRDCGARNVAELDDHEVGDLAHARDRRDDVLRMHHRVVGAVVDEVEGTLADRGNGPARADEYHLARHNSAPFADRPPSGPRA
jgi:hypothetical protein